MDTAFYISAGVAVLATAMIITRRHAVHALLYLVVSLLAVAVVFFTLGAHLAAALEVIIYAGAIMVLFIFAVMMLNLGPSAIEHPRLLTSVRAWAGPAVLGAVLLGTLLWAIMAEGSWDGPDQLPAPTPQQVGLRLIGSYMLIVELASLLLLSALVGVLHLSRPAPEGQP